MHLDGLIADLALILVVAGIVTIIFKKINQPIVLGYIIAGFLISPNFIYLPTIVDEADIEVWANIGVIFLMFGLGLEFSFKKIAKVGGSAFVIVFTVMTVMILIGAGVGNLLGWGKMDCIFLGGMLSMSSTMIILKAYEEFGIKEQPHAQMVLGALVIEDIAGIFMLIVLSTISVGQNVSGRDLVVQLSLLLVYLVIWLLVGIYVIPTFLRYTNKLLNDEMVVVISLAICLAMVVIANLIGFSSALGAFMAGSILAGTVQSGRIETLVKPIKDLFGAIFFVSVGMMIVPEMLIQYIIPILVLSVVVILGQMIFSTIGTLLSGQNLETAVKVGFSMVQIGEFSFIVATLGKTLGVISDNLYPIVVCVSVITSFLTPVFIKNSDKAYALVKDKMPDKLWVFLARNTSKNQSKRAMDEEWLTFITRVVIRTLICSAFMYVIYLLGTDYLEPFLDSRMGSGYAAEVLSCVISLAFMVPFVNFMHKTNQPLYVKLWVKHRSNHLPLITLKTIRVLIAACFMALVIRAFFRIPFFILVLVAAVPIFFIIRSDFITGVTTNMRIRFVSNFSDKALAKQKKERQEKGSIKWLNESMYIIEFRITDVEEGTTILDFTEGRRFMVTIIRIIRNGEYINMPSANDVVMKGDILHMLGTWDEVDACTIMLEDDDSIEYTEADDEILKDYIYAQRFNNVPEDKELVCVPIKVEKGSDLIRRSIKTCGIRQKYKASIIGIERGNLTTASPGIQTIIRRDDLLWLMGGHEMLERLVKAGLMDM